MTSADEPAVLALNAAAVEQTDPLGPDRLDWLRLIAAHAAVVEIEGEIAAFVLTFAPGSAHDSLDFQWFVSTYADRFLHLDRIVVARPTAARASPPRSTGPSNAPPSRSTGWSAGSSPIPPTTASLAFHAGRGFVEVGKLRRPDGTTSAMLSKELAD